jgi:hypothetical protein
MYPHLIFLFLFSLANCMVFPKCENITFSQVISTSNQILDAALDDNGMMTTLQIVNYLRSPFLTIVTTNDLPYRHAHFERNCSN